jgi:type 1 glutamine amidotransferase
MKKPVKITLWVIAALVVSLVLFMSFFIYKVRYGLPIYETDIPVIEFPADKTKVLLFSKSTGFRHSESIDAGKKTFEELASKNNWFLYSTEDGGVFNPEQLAKFDVVIFNNSTGRLLNKEQEQNLATYVESGGSLIGIHGAGDNSHNFDWYTRNLVGSEFSHHPIEKHLQEAEVTLNPVPDSILVEGLPKSFTTTDEWYVFLDNPRAKGFNILYTIDGDKIVPNGNILFVKDKNFGMGKDHPVAWYKATAKGRTFYTSMGHDATEWAQPAFVRMLENAVNHKDASILIEE